MNQNKRHKSVINPSDLFQMQSPQKTTVSSIGSSSSVNKLPLRSNSIFAYQEYDEFSSFIDNTNNYKTSSSIQSPENINNNSLNQSRDSSSYSDSEETFEKIDQKKLFIKKGCRTEMYFTTINKCLKTMMIIFKKNWLIIIINLQLCHPIIHKWEEV